MHNEFKVHMLNDAGKALATGIANAFDDCLSNLEMLCGKDGREMAIVRTKLEEACFFAKKAMASNPNNSVTSP